VTYNPNCIVAEETKIRWGDYVKLKNLNYTLECQLLGKHVS